MNDYNTEVVETVASLKAILCIINTIKYYYASPHNGTKNSYVQTESVVSIDP